MAELDKLYTFKSDKIYKAQDIYDLYNFKTGYNVGMVHDQFFDLGYTTTLVVSKMRGEYPDYEREPKYKGFIFDRFTKFVQVKQGEYKEVEI